MLDSIETRVRDWPQTISYYSDPAHAAASRATESVLNAFILSSYDRRSGELAEITRRAFAEAWALQTITGDGAGGWPWQDLQESPWESSESAYWGAALMALALNNTPEEYRREPEVDRHLATLQQYLRRTYSEQPMINQLYVIWAAAEMPGLIRSGDRSRFIARIERLQQRDGGWSLISLNAHKTRESELLDLVRHIDRAGQSDGCGTGLAVLGLEKADVDLNDPVFRSGLRWLEQHQYQDGSWWAPSLNGVRKTDSELGRFMSDAASGYAVLAMEEARSAEDAAGTADAVSAKSSGITNQLH